MFRAIIAIFFIFIAILWLPLWLQLVLFFIAVLSVPHRLLLFIPAIFSDVLYAPTNEFNFRYLKMTMIVGALVLLWWLITNKTRIGNQYVSTTR